MEIKRKKNLTKWNRKIHIYLGLALLIFIWLFGISGLLLNHHWKIANSWEKRKETTYERTIEVNREREKQILVEEVMDKLNLSGSIYNLRYSDDSARLDFIVSRPGIRYDVKANLDDGKISIKETKFDSWEVLRTLHKLRNPTPKEQGERYQPAWASIWSFSIDVVSAGFIAICLGGWYLWFQADRRRFYLGLISICAGFILCIYFLLF